MTELVKVVYVGRKPTAIDNVARSGKTWAGAGDVQTVTPQQAKILTGYADQWALVNPADAEVVAAPLSFVVTGADGEVVRVHEAALSTPLEKMSKPELMALAKKKWRRTLDLAIPKKHMIDQIEEWQKELGD